jgi:putative ABC transport system permease protein
VSRKGDQVLENGRFEAPEKSWLISYDQNQLKWAKEDLVAGTLSEETLNRENGVIAVANNIRKGITSQTADLQLGDKVYINTPAGTKVCTVMGVLRTIPFSDDQLNLTQFIVTEKQFKAITGKDTRMVIDIQLKKKNQEQTITQIKGLLDREISYYDYRQKNRETDQTFLTMAVFVYGFVAVIALISILNIFSVMNTSIASKIRYLGVLRAVGMSGRQLLKMIVAEAGTYCLSGCVIGCILGVMLQKFLAVHFLSAIKIVWSFPWEQLAGVLIVTVFITGLSVIRPLKKIKTQGIAEVVGSL